MFLRFFLYGILHWIYRLLRGLICFTSWFLNQVKCHLRWSRKNKSKFSWTNFVFGLFFLSKCNPYFFINFNQPRLDVQSSCESLALLIHHYIKYRIVSYLYVFFFIGFYYFSFIVTFRKTIYALLYKLLHCIVRKCIYCFFIIQYGKTVCFTRTWNGRKQRYRSFQFFYYLDSYYEVSYFFLFCSIYDNLL